MYSVCLIELRFASVGSTVWLCTRTWERQGDWADQRTFLTRTIEDGGDSARMRVNLGNLELGEGHADRALEEYRAALARNPTLVFAHFGRATALLRTGEFAGARAEVDQCGTGHGLDAQIVQLRAAIDYAEKQIDPAPAYKNAADLSPLNWPHRKRYITTLAESGRMIEATRELRAFLDQQPYRADSWLLLGNLLTRSAQRDSAAIAFGEARARDVHLKFGPLAGNGANGSAEP